MVAGRARSIYDAGKGAHGCRHAVGPRARDAAGNAVAVSGKTVDDATRNRVSHSCHKKKRPAKGAGRNSLF